MAARKKKTSKSTAKPEPEEVEAEPIEEAEKAAGGPVHDVPPDAPPGAEPAAAALNDSSASSWALACHLCGLADFFNLVPGLGILLPLVVWLVKRDDHPFIDEQGKEAINFQINVLFWTLVFGALSLCCIGLPFLLALPIVETVLIVLAAIEVANGRPYRYPLVVRLLD